MINYLTSVNQKQKEKKVVLAPNLKDLIYEDCCLDLQAEVQDEFKQIQLIGSTSNFTRQVQTMREKIG